MKNKEKLLRNTKQFSGIKVYINYIGCFKDHSEKKDLTEAFSKLTNNNNSTLRDCLYFCANNGLRHVAIQNGYFLNYINFET